MKVINFYGGPGSGKSTAAAGLFYMMKKSRYSVELVTEFAKDLVYEENTHMLSQQNYVFANQEYRLSRLKGKVEYVITDCPLILSTIYAPKDYPRSFQSLCVDLYKTYDNINIFIDRNHEYVPEGRLQTEEESNKICNYIKMYLDFINEPYHIFKAGDETPEEIKNLLGI